MKTKGKERAAHELDGTLTGEFKVVIMDWMCSDLWADLVVVSSF